VENVLLPSLRLDVNQKPKRLTAEARAGDDVCLVSLAVGDIRKYLLVQKFDRFPIKIGGQPWKEQFDEFHEKRRQ
jgi:hypothetical protein